VEVIYGGVSNAFRPVDDFRLIEEIRSRHGIRADYFLFVGVFNRRKNLSSLLQAYHIYRSRHRDDRVMLVCCGKPGVGSEEFFRDIDRLGMVEDVKILRAASDTELAALMTGCRALLLPSLGEGFGLPVAEAMACGAPVICGNQCAMKEVAGDAALTVNPTDVEALANAMENIVFGSQLAQSLRGRGIERARLFTWQRTAEGVRELYRRLM